MIALEITKLSLGDQFHLCSFFLKLNFVGITAKGGPFGALIPQNFHLTFLTDFTGSHNFDSLSEIQFAFILRVDLSKEPPATGILYYMHIL